MFSVQAIVFIIIIAILLIALLQKSIAQKKCETSQSQSLDLETLDTIKLPIICRDKNGKIYAQNKQFGIAFGNYKKQALELLRDIKTTTQEEIELIYDNDVKKKTMIFSYNFLGKKDDASNNIVILLDISKFHSQKQNFIDQKNTLSQSLWGAQEGYWQWDIKSNKVTFSKKALEILGYEEDELPPQTLSDWLNIIESYDIAKTNEAFSLHIKGEIDHIDVTHRLKTGLKEKWVNTRGTACINQSDKTGIVYGVLRDVTVEREAFASLQKEKDLFMTFMDNLPALAYIKDKNGKYIYINTFFEKLLGFKKWKNKTDAEIFDKNTAAHIIKSDREALYEGIIKSEQIIPDESGIKKMYETHKFPISSSEEKVLCGFGLDVTKEKSYLSKINLYLKVFENASEAIMITDARGLIVDTNRAYEQLASLSKKALIGKNPNIRASGKHSSEFYKHMWDSLLKDGAWRGEIINKDANGAECTELLSISCIKDALGNVKNYIGISQNIENQKMVEELLRKQAYFDALTKLPNRLLFQDRLASALKRVEKNGMIMALVFIDLDDFKIINDTKGHDCGDEVLRQSAQRLEQIARSSDTAARLGGDEFVVIFEHINALQDIPEIAQKIIDSLSAPIVLDDGTTCSVGASLGVSISPQHSILQSELLKFADIAMYKAKQAGKNCYKIYGSD